MKFQLPVLIFSFFIYACTPAQKSIGNKEIVIFNNEPINFNPEQNRTNLNDSIIKIDNGRIILKKIILPEYSKHVNISIEAEVTSAGDPWIKADLYLSYHHQAK